MKEFMKQPLVTRKVGILIGGFQMFQIPSKQFNSAAIGF
jgi:hypothetical protein